MATPAISTHYNTTDIRWSPAIAGQSKESGFHSIDSDDEEEYEKSKKIETLDVDEDVEGVEDSTIDRDGEIAITAFNLKDEEEDGHFGKERGSHISRVCPKS